MSFYRTQLGWIKDNVRKGFFEKFGRLGWRLGHVGRSQDGRNVEQVAEEGEDEEEDGEALDMRVSMCNL